MWRKLPPRYGGADEHRCVFQGERDGTKESRAAYYRSKYENKKKAQPCNREHHTFLGWGETGGLRAHTPGAVCGDED